MLDTALLVAALLPCHAPECLEPFAPQMPEVLLTQARRLHANLQQDLVFYERAYAVAVSKQNAVEMRMRAFHIRTAKAHIQGLAPLLILAQHLT